MRLRYLEAFWESEAPRVGDERAEGWGAWLINAEKELTAAKQAAAAAAAPAADTPTAASAWVEYKDSTGRPYYYNTATQQTQWDRPAEAVTAAPQPAAEMAGGTAAADAALAAWQAGEDPGIEAQDGGEKPAAEAAAGADASELGVQAASGEWDDSDDDEANGSAGEEEEAAALLEATSAESAAERVAAAAAKEVEASEAEDVRRLLRWGETEIAAGQRVWWPPTSSSSAEADTEGVVLFDDVSHALLRYSTPALRMELAAELLQVLGAPCPAAAEQAGYARPQLPRVAMVDGEVGGLFALAQSLEEELKAAQERKRDRTSSTDNSTLDLRTEMLAVLSFAEGGAGWTAGCRGLEALTGPAGTAEAGSEGRERAWIGVVRNVFRLLTASAFGSSEVCGARLCSGWLRFEFGSDGDSAAAEARGVAKQLLGQERWGADIGVWRAFGSAEETVGNVLEAQKIYDAALAMPAAGALTDARRQEELFAVRRSYAALELAQGSRARALHILTSGLETGQGFVSIRPSSKKKKKKKSGAENPPAVTPIAVATARRAYARASDASAAAAAGGTGGSVHAVVCHALLEFLTNGFRGMCAVFDAALRDTYDPDGAHPSPGQTDAPATAGLESEKRRLAPGAEAVYAAYVKYTVAHFASDATTSPRAVRSVLQRAIDAFPTNPSFLSCWLLTEGSSQIAAHLRTFFHGHCRREGAGATDPSVWLFAAHFEGGRVGAGGAGRGSSQPRVVNLFERALECPEVYHAPVLWAVRRT